MPVDEFGLDVPKEKHFLDLMMACLKKPHGFGLRLGAPMPSPHDGRCLILLTGHNAQGIGYQIPYYFRLPRDLLKKHSKRPTVEFMESLQRGIDSKAEEGRQRMCRHYVQHAEKSS